MLKSLSGVTTPAELPSGLKSLLGSARTKQGLPRALFDVSLTHLDAHNGLLLVFWGDWHLGGQGVDYERFEQDTQQLATAQALLGDRLAVIGMGDYIDGYLQGGGTPRNPTQLLSPQEQRAAVQEAFSFVKPSLIIEGDHDLWHSKSEIEYEWVHELAQLLKVPFAQWGTELVVTHREGELTGLIRHRYKGSRAHDPLKPHKNLHLEHGPADLVALAHFHSYPGVYRAHAKRRSEGMFTAVQSGTYKRYDEYGKKLGFKDADYGVPAVYISADGQIRTFDHYEDALERML